MSRRSLLVWQFVALLGFWLLLSGRFDPLFLLMAVVSSAGVAALTARLVADVIPDAHEVEGTHLSRAWGFVVFAGWLLVRILVASAQMVYFVLHPRMPLEPALLRLRTDLRTPMARVILANSITLVPGTYTLRLDDDELLVHVLIPGAASDLLDATMQNKVGAIFGDPPQPSPQVLWDPHEEVGA